MCAFKLAEALSIPVYSALEFVADATEVALLSGSNGVDSEWSALTMKTKVGNRIIIHNTFHSELRQQSNIMHELAHVICKHEVDMAKYNFAVPFGMREFDPIQEEEAKCLGATLQISRPCLLWARKRSLSVQEISEHFKASSDMVTYRLNMTGLNKKG
jgi:Zn-dependent peptidase ImmA (M78 family)